MKDSLRQAGKSAGRTATPAPAPSPMSRAGASAAAFSERKPLPVTPRHTPYGYNTPPVTPPKMPSYFPQLSYAPRYEHTPPATPPQARVNLTNAFAQPTYGYVTSGVPYQVPDYKPPQSSHPSIVSDASSYEVNASMPPNIYQSSQAYQPRAYSPRTNTAGSTASSTDSRHSSSSRPSSSSSMRSFWNSCKQAYHDAPPGEGELAVHYYREWRTKRAVKKAEAATSQPMNIPPLSRKDRKGSFTESLSSSLRSIGNGWSFDTHMAQKQQKKTDAKKAQISVPILSPSGTGSVTEGSVLDGDYPVRAIPKYSVEDFGEQMLMDKRHPTFTKVDVSNGKPAVAKQKGGARVTKLGDFMGTSKLTAALKRKDSDESFFCAGEGAAPDYFLERCLKCGKEDRRYMRKGLCKECTEAASHSQEPEPASLTRASPSNEGEVSPATSFSFSTSSLPDLPSMTDLPHSVPDSRPKLELTSFSPEKTTYADPPETIPPPPTVTDDDEDFAGWLKLWRKKAAAKDVEDKTTDEKGEPRSLSRNTGFYDFYDEIMPKTPKEPGSRWR